MTAIGRSPHVSHIWSETPWRKHSYYGGVPQYRLLTIASVVSDDGRYIAYGVALCGPGDQPSRPRGRAIALGRADQALGDYLRGENPDPGWKANQARLKTDDFGPRRHAWVLRTEDLDPVALIRGLRAQVRQAGANASMALVTLAGHLDAALARRLS